MTTPKTPPTDVELPEPEIMCDCGGDYYTAGQMRTALAERDAARREAEELRDAKGEIQAEAANYCAEAHALLQELEGLRASAGPAAWRHDYLGGCPDELQPDARDPACAACRYLMASAGPAETQSLIRAAQAVVDRWDTPLWKDAPATGVFINTLP